MGGFFSIIYGSLHGRLLQIDGSSTLQREDAVGEHEGGDLHHQAGSVEIYLIHGFKTSKPCFDFDTQGRSLPVGSFLASSFDAQLNFSLWPS